MTGLRMTPGVNRRRFLTIASAAALLPAAGRAAAPRITDWRGIALGAEARLILAHPDSDRLVAAALDELARLERIFSLYRRDSELARLNAAGVLDAPSNELVELLALAGLVHDATGGVFDPSIQPLWAAYAAAGAEGRAPTDPERTAALARVGWEGVTVDPGRITLRPGMALTLNGIAQGYITDRVAARLAALGLSDLLCEMGEIAALGHAPGGTAWAARLSSGEPVPLSGRCLASSAPRATAFDQAGRLGHILDPRTGVPSDRDLALVSVSAPSAALADALSTAGCLMARADLDRSAARFAEVRIEAYRPS